MKTVQTHLNLIEVFLAPCYTHVLHSCHHELETARINGLLGNIDANTGDPQVGIDDMTLFTFYILY